MLTFGLIALGVSALGFLFFVHLWFWGRYYRPGHGAVDEIHFARTADRWRLALHRYRPEASQDQRRPLLLCHGIAANRYSFDLSRGTSLARYLRAQGWDVWVLELRGVGESSRPRFMGRRGWNWQVDDYLEKDLPAAIDYVCAQSQSPSLHWIGHSLGGTLGLVAAQGSLATKLASVSVLGSPFFFHPSEAARNLIRLSRVFSWTRALRLRVVARAFAPFFFHLRARMVVLNVANIRGHVARRALSHMVADICQKVVSQLGDAVRRGHLELAGQDIQGALAHVRRPALLLYGAADSLATTEEGRRIHEALGGESRLHFLGRNHGHREDYGHGDLLLGRHVREEVFPLIAQWLSEQLKNEQARQAPAPEPLELEPVEASSIPGPYGLLNRYSPSRRRRWFEQLAAFRTKQAEERLLDIASIPDQPEQEAISKT